MISLAAIPGILQKIPLAALAAMLISTGFRLASPREFMHVLHIGRDQLLLFVTTMMVTLASDLLIGVAAGLMLKVILHLKNGVSFKNLFKGSIQREKYEKKTIICFQGPAVFTNYLSLKWHLETQSAQVERVIIDSSDALLVDHTVLSKLSNLQKSWTNRDLIITGFDHHVAHSSHDLAVRRKLRGLRAS